MPLGGGGLAFAQRVDGGLAVGRLGDFLDANGIEQYPQERAHMRIVLDNERFHALKTGTRHWFLRTGHKQNFRDGE